MSDEPSSPPTHATREDVLRIRELDLVQEALRLKQEILDRDRTAVTAELRAKYGADVVSIDSDGTIRRNVG